MIEFCAQATAAFPKLPHRPTTDMIDKLLQTPLPILPCAHEVPPSIVASHPYLAPKHPEVASTFSEIPSLVIAVLKDRSVFRGNYSENSYIQLWDTLIWDTLSFFGTQLPSLDLECNRIMVDIYGTAATHQKRDQISYAG